MSRFSFGRDVIFKKTAKELSSHFQSDSSLLIYDLALEKIPQHSRLISSFSHRVGFQSGESLKDLSKFSQRVARILKKRPQVSRRELQIVVLGGGSLGDFAGFFAAVFQRGVKLIQVPTTWLAAVDSAHGGKNALNVGKVKNQIGTYHFPQKVLICRELLPFQKERLIEASGEIFKAYLLDPRLRKQFFRISEWNESTVWQLLPAAVDLKYRIVRKDPYEQKKIRYALNLGHSVAHAFELDQKLPHGLAVLFGVEFALNWSKEKSFFPASEYQNIKNSSLVHSLNKLKEQTRYRKINLSRLLKKRKMILQVLQLDKKRNLKSGIDEVFLSGQGFRVTHVNFKEFSQELERQSENCEAIF